MWESANSCTQRNSWVVEQHLRNASLCLFIQPLLSVLCLCKHGYLPPLIVSVPCVFMYIFAYMRYGNFLSWDHMYTLRLLLSLPHYSLQRKSEEDRRNDNVCEVPIAGSMVVVPYCYVWSL